MRQEKNLVGTNQNEAPQATQVTEKQSTSSLVGEVSLLVKDLIALTPLPNVSLNFQGLSLGLTDEQGYLNAPAEILGESVKVILGAKYGWREVDARVSPAANKQGQVEVKVAAKTQINIRFNSDTPEPSTEELILYLAPTDYARDQDGSRLYPSISGKRALHSARTHYAMLKRRQVKSNSVYRKMCLASDVLSFLVDQPGTYNLSVSGQSLFADQRLECLGGKTNDFAIQLDTRLGIQALIVDVSGAPLPEARVKIHTRMSYGDTEILPGADRFARQTLHGKYVVHSKTLRADQDGEVSWSSRFSNEVTIVAFKRDQQGRRSYYGHFHRKLAGRRSKVPRLKVVLQEFGQFGDSMKIDSKLPIKTMTMHGIVRHYKDFGIQFIFPCVYKDGRILVDILQPGIPHELSCFDTANFIGKNVEFFRQPGRPIVIR